MGDSNNQTKMKKEEFIKFWKQYLREMAFAQSKSHFTTYTPTFEGFMKWLELQK